MSFIVSSSKALVNQLITSNDIIFTELTFLELHNQLNF